LRRGVEFHRRHPARARRGVDLTERVAGLLWFVNQVIEASSSGFRAGLPTFGGTVGLTPPLCPALEARSHGMAEGSQYPAG